MRECPSMRERESGPFDSSVYMFFSSPGPALCKLNLARSAVLPEVLTLVLGPSFDLLLFYLCGLSLPCLLGTTILDSCFLF